MQNFDFLSIYPQVYVNSMTRARNKLGGFLSILNLLIIMGVCIFYFIKYFYGKEFDIKYFNEPLQNALSNDDLIDLSKRTMEVYFRTFPIIDNNCKIIPIIAKNNSHLETNLSKCNDKLEIDSKGQFYCFNFSFSTQFLLGISGNCTDDNGRPFNIYAQLFVPNMHINHKNSYPFKSWNKSLENSILTNLPLDTSKNSLLQAIYQFTPILYKSNNILSRKNDRFKEIYLSNLQTITINQENVVFIKEEKINLIYSIVNNLDLNCDVYEREYISLIDTLSKIGGLFSPLKLFLSFLIHFYSRYENNYQIVKNLVLKKNIYKNNINNNIVKADAKMELNIERELMEKKNKINSSLEYFGIIFKCCWKRRRTMKILNLCNNFVREHMSAENLIFNSILFEKYYEENPIRNFHHIEGLKEIEKELYNYSDDNENELLVINDNT